MGGASSSLHVERKAVEIGMHGGMQVFDNLALARGPALEAKSLETA